MNAKQLEPGTWALVFEKGDEPISQLERFAKEQRLLAASFTAGARGTLDVARRLYVAASPAVAGEADGRQAAVANPSN